MRIAELEARTPERIARLVEIWEKSVRATHLFLSAGEIEAIKAYVPQALKEVPHLVTAEEERGLPAGFMGIGGQRLEMLFLSPEERGKGLGRKLLQYGMDRYQVGELAVNEQNPQARGFYERMGFHVYKRTETDEQGGPYPLLYMKL
jgi:putative acetyltransferase|nr:GNAT family N-acetyltransferase [uncultured Oscillibacter sp.]